MTERLYYTDAYLRAFEARIVKRVDDGRRIYLDRSAFYPDSGGQLSDRGSISGSVVLDVVDEDDEVAHVLVHPVSTDVVACVIDWSRRFDFMQQHSGQHLLSAVFVQLFGIETISVHMGETTSTVDLATAAISPDQIAQAEARANEIVFENRPLSIRFADASEDLGLRKTTDRTGTIRVVSIDQLDRSACGGTHVRSTGEIGPILIRKSERIRGSVRLEFLCGGRAVSRARTDYNTLSRIAQQFSAALEETPSLVEGQIEAAKTAGKQVRKLEADLARYQGRELYDAIRASASGLRILVRAADSLETLRPLGQSFCSNPRAIFIASAGNSVLAASSEDSGFDCGQRLKAALIARGGRGGGTARMAQGSIPDPAAIPSLLDELQRL